MYIILLQKHIFKKRDKNTITKQNNFIISLLHSLQIMICNKFRAINVMKIFTQMLKLHRLLCNLFTFSCEDVIIYNTVYGFSCVSIMIALNETANNKPDRPDIVKPVCSGIIYHTNTAWSGSFTEKNKHVTVAKKISFKLSVQILQYSLSLSLSQAHSLLFFCSLSWSQSHNEM